MKSFLVRIFAMHPLALTAAVCLIALTIPAYRWLDAERANVGAIPKAIDKQGELTRTFLGTWLTANAMPPINRIAGTVDGLPVMARDLIDTHATRIETGVLGEVRHGVDESAALVKESLHVVDARGGELLGIARDLQTNAKPVLVNSAALVKDVQDSLDSNYDDLVGLLDSATVATTQAAQAAQTFNQQFPALVTTLQQTNTHIASATGSLAAMFAAADHKYFHPPPKTFKQKLVGGLEDAGLIGLAILKATH